MKNIEKKLDLTDLINAGLDKIVKRWSKTTNYFNKYYSQTLFEHNDMHAPAFHLDEDTCYFTLKEHREESAYNNNIIVGLYHDFCLPHIETRICENCGQPYQYCTLHGISDDHVCKKEKVITRCMHYCARTEEDGCANEAAHRQDGEWTTPVYLYTETTESYETNVDPSAEWSDELSAYVIETTSFDNTNTANGHGDPVHYAVDVKKYE